MRPVLCAEPFRRATIDFEALAQNLRVEGELLRIRAALDGIPFAVFKGPILTKRLFHNLDSRESRDNDILVRQRDGVAALSRLVERGYLPLHEEFEPALVLQRTGQISLAIPGAPERPSLDLHIRAFSDHFFAVDEEFLWNSLVTTKVQGESFLTFGDDLMFCHLVAHYIQHLFEPEMLRELDRGVEVFCQGGPSSTLVDTVRATVGVRAADFATAMSGRPWREAEIGAGVWIANVLREFPLPKTTLVRGAIALAVSDPSRWSRALFAAFVPSHDELSVRYGDGSYVPLLLKHTLYRFGWARMKSPGRE